jgi:hypothetical protein
MHACVCVYKQGRGLIRTVSCSFFKKYSEKDFARSGTTATEDVIIPAGPLPFQHTMVDQLRKLGLPVMLKTGDALSPLTLKQHDRLTMCVSKHRNNTRFVQYRCCDL